MSFYTSKKDAAAFVSDWLHTSNRSSVLTMIMPPGMSEGCSVRIVTDVSLEDIEKMWEQASSRALMNTSQQNTPAG